MDILGTIQISAFIESNLCGLRTIIELCCCRENIFPIGGCFICCRQNSNNGDNDDIDAAFAKYKYEMRLKELENTQNVDSAFENMDRYRVLGEDSYLITAGTGVSNGEPIGISANVQNRKYWNWDNSLRSNCDNFLETLEYDIGAKPLFESFK